MGISTLPWVKALVGFGRMSMLSFSQFFGRFRVVSISRIQWVKILIGLVLMSMLLLISSCFLPLGRSDENPSWFHQISLGTTGLRVGRNYIIPEMRELCDQNSSPVIDDFVNGGYAYSPFEIERTIGKFEATAGMTANVNFDCFPCIQELLVDTYPFIEVFYVSGKDVKHVERISTFQFPGRHSENDGYVTETGWYRYSLVDRETNPELCALYDYVANPITYDSTRSKAKQRALLKARATRRRIPAFRKKMLASRGKCIAIEKIKAPTARHLVENFSVVQQEIDALVGDGLILRETSRVSDRSTGKVFVSQDRFSYWHRLYRSGRKINSRDSYTYVSSCGAKLNFLNTRLIVHP